MSRHIRGAAIVRYAEVATQVGLDARAMLRRVDIDSRFLSEPELRVPADKVLDLLEQSAQASGCETFGLQMAERRRLSDYGALALLLTHQPTLRDIMQTRMRYQRMLNEVLALHLQESEGVAVAREEISAGGRENLRQAYELAVGTTCAIFRGLLGAAWRPQSVHFTHAPPADLTVHLRAFGGQIEFESTFNGFTCRSADLDTRNPQADPALVEHAERYVSTLPFANDSGLVVEVQKAIHVLLPFNGASISAVAGRLGVNARTLQRRLADEGAEFSRLLNEIRREHALRYLGNLRVPIAEVAALVGYSRDTSFARWFLSEFGVSPTAWRTAPH